MLGNADETIASISCDLVSEIKLQCVIEALASDVKLNLLADLEQYWLQLFLSMYGSH